MGSSGKSHKHDACPFCVLQSVKAELEAMLSVPNFGKHKDRTSPLQAAILYKPLMTDPSLLIVFFKLVLILNFVQFAKSMHRSKHNTLAKGFTPGGRVIHPL